MSVERVVLASNNAGKLRELAALLAPLQVTLVAQSDLGVGEADEPHPTFVENALAKARHASRLTGLPALADDSGICANALAGAPGVRSARYATLAGAAPRAVQDAANNARLVAELAAHADRSAYYCCVLVLMRAPDDPRPLIAEGLWHGEVIAQPRGGGGFGYDPHFLLADGRTAAELSAEEKNALSHRAIAMRALLASLRE
ncbi:MAG TPA: RdgB/HAM1 family non-canonical purine NTP pyrophosphatase [Burkholderiaceae bacterium]